jgi:hypothetical protein
LQLDKLAALVAEADAWVAASQALLAMQPNSEQLPMLRTLIEQGGHLGLQVPELEQLENRIMVSA